MKRIEQGMEVTNPFLLETESLYPNEFALAERIVDMFHERLNVLLPDAETGFIALHIHSATTFKNVLEVNRHNQIIGQIVQTIESRLNVKLDRTSLDYKRLLRHLRYAVERVATGEMVEAPQKIEKVLRDEYPLCYSTAWELMGIMERELKRPVPRGEATYLTMHLQRLTSR
jgi:transcriptional antiterminator/beta-glucoside operon transcriptional antiterminator